MMKDFYTRKSREEGYYARSVYKLKDINKKYELIRKGDKVLDLVLFLKLRYFLMDLGNNIWW